MYKISGIVKDGQLGAAVQALHNLVEEVLVTPLQSVQGQVTERITLSGPAQRAIKRFDSGRKTPVIQGTAKRGKRKSFKRDGSLQNAALELIGQQGVPAFKLIDLMARAEAVGVERPAVMRAIGLEMKAGRMTRVSKGVYQRKGAAVAQSAGLGQLA